jgi:hypothetical protein
MGRRPVKDKKMPSDYPMLGFRISVDDKKRLTDLIEQVQANLNRRRKEGDPWINKNDVVVRALYEGLKRIKPN